MAISSEVEELRGNGVICRFGESPDPNPPTNYKPRALSSPCRRFSYLRRRRRRYRLRLHHRGPPIRHSPREWHQRFQIQARCLWLLWLASRSSSWCSRCCICSSSLQKHCSGNSYLSSSTRLVQSFGINFAKGLWLIHWQSLKLVGIFQLNIWTRDKVYLLDAFYLNFGKAF